MSNGRRSNGRAFTGVGRRMATSAAALAIMMLPVVVEAGIAGNAPANAAPEPGTTSSQTFEFTAAPQSFVVPDGVTTITVEVWGASGGAGGTCAENGCGPGGVGGKGAHVVAQVAVTPGETLAILVGGRGTDGATIPAGACTGSQVDGGHGGWFNAPNGGAGGCPAAPGGGGGYASSILRGDLANPASRVLLVLAGAGAGGGGGGNEDEELSHPAGGAGGNSGSDGVDGEGTACKGGGGKGGQSGLDPAGGAGGTSFGATDGDAGAAGGPEGSAVGLGTGGDGGVDENIAGGGGGGGGGGVIIGGGGGGGGANHSGCGGPGGGGGGGRSFTGPGVTGTNTDGVNTGNGRVIVSFTVPIPVGPAFTG